MRILIFLIGSLLWVTCSACQAQMASGSSNLEGVNESAGVESTSGKRIKDGVLREYHKNGNVLSEINYKRGVPKGEGKTYYEDGKIQSEMQFDDGKLVSSINYFRSGQRMTEMTFKDGELVHVKQYDKDGKIIHDRDVLSGPGGEATEDTQASNSTGK